MAIKKMAAKKVVKKTAVKKPIAKKPIRKMQDGGKIDKLTKDKLKRAGVSKEEYTRVMNDNSKMPTRAAGRVSMTGQYRNLARNAKRGEPENYGADEISRKNMDRNLHKALVIAVANAGSPGTGFEVLKTDGNIINAIPGADLKGYLSKNPKVLDEMDQFTKQRLAEKGMMPTFKKGGVKKSTTKKVVMRKGGKVTSRKKK